LRRTATAIGGELTEPLDFPLLRQTLADTRGEVAFADLGNYDLRFIYVNPALVNMTGNTPGSHWQELPVPANDQTDPLVTEAIRDAGAAGIP
jgi:hypothetical protein